MKFVVNELHARSEDNFFFKREGMLQSCLYYCRQE